MLPLSIRLAKFQVLKSHMCYCIGSCHPRPKGVGGYKAVVIAFFGASVNSSVNY